MAWHWKPAIGDTISYVSCWRQDRHFTWSSEPREGLAIRRVKTVPLFLSYFKTLSIRPAPGIEPATPRCAVKRSINWAYPVAAGDLNSVVLKTFEINEFRVNLFTLTIFQHKWERSFRWLLLLNVNTIPCFQSDHVRHHLHFLLDFPKNTKYRLKTGLLTVRSTLMSAAIKCEACSVSNCWDFSNNL